MFGFKGVKFKNVKFESLVRHQVQMSVGTLDVEIWTSEERFEPKIEICE